MSKELKEKHEKIRNILMDYGNEEYGDCIIDEISEAIGILPTLGELCKDKLAIGDDFGDNTCTFVCGLQKDHPGKCREVFTSDGREDIVIEWNKK